MSTKPLKKSPVTFDSESHNKPYVEVWRMQNEHGIGPYGLASNWEDKKKDPSVNPPPLKDSGFTESDINEGGFNRGLNRSGFQKKGRYPFAFETIDHLNQWFSPSEQKRLAKQGFKPTKVKAVKVWSSKKQSFYIPHYGEDSELTKARIDEGKSVADKKAARDKRASSWERKDYGMGSGNSDNPEVQNFLHRSKLNQIKEGPTPKLPKSEEPMDKSIEDQMFYEKHRKQVHAQGKARRAKMEQKAANPGFVTKLTNWAKGKMKPTTTIQAAPATAEAKPEEPGKLAASEPLDKAVIPFKKPPVKIGVSPASINQQNQAMGPARPASAPQAAPVTHISGVPVPKELHSFMQSSQVVPYDHPHREIAAKFVSDVWKKNKPEGLRVSQNLLGFDSKGNLTGAGKPNYTTIKSEPMEKTARVDQGKVFIEKIRDRRDRKIASQVPEKGVHTGYSRGDGESKAGARYRAGSAPDHGMYGISHPKTLKPAAIDAHKQNLADLKSMPKPKLTRAEKDNKEYAAPTPADVSAPVIHNTRRTNTGRHYISAPDMIVGYANGASPSGGPQPKEKQPMKKAELAKNLKKALTPKLEKANRFETNAGMGTKSANSNPAVAKLKTHLRDKVTPRLEHGSMAARHIKGVHKPAVGDKSGSSNMGLHSNNNTRKKHVLNVMTEAGHIKPNLPKSEANPDEKADAQLGEQVENIVENHMIDNKAAEQKEGHKIEPVNKSYMGFKAVERKVAASGASNPAAVAASIGRKKYGKEAFQHAAAAGKKMGKNDEPMNKVDPKSHLPGTLLDKSAEPRKKMVEGLKKCYGSKLMKDSAVTNTSDTAEEKKIVRASNPTATSPKIKQVKQTTIMGSIPNNGMSSSSSSGSLGKAEIPGQPPKKFPAGPDGLTALQRALKAKKERDELNRPHREREEAERKAKFERDEAARRLQAEALRPENIKLDHPKYLTVEQHYDSTLNGKPNPIRENGKKGIEHIDDLKALNEYHGRNVVKGIHNEPPKGEWGTHTFLLHPTGYMEYMSSNADTSDSSGTKRGGKVS